MAKSEITVHIADLPRVEALTAALHALLAYCDEIDRADVFPGLADTDVIRSVITTTLGHADSATTEEQR